MGRCGLKKWLAEVRDRARDVVYDAHEAQERDRAARDHRRPAQPLCLLRHALLHRRLALEASFKKREWPA